MPPPTGDYEDGAQDADLARAGDWWEAELDQLIAHGFDPEKAARTMVTTGAVRLANLEGPAEAAAQLEALARSLRSVNGPLT